MGNKKRFLELAYGYIEFSQDHFKVPNKFQMPIAFN